jgi:transcriptional regulator with XRE-family HTH domain
METQPVAVDAIGRTVADNVRAEMHRQGLTWRDLTERTGISRTQLARALNGSRSFHLNEVALLAVALRVDIASLVAPTERS